MLELFRKRTASGFASVVIGNHGVSTARIQQSASSLPQLQDYDFLPMVDPDANDKARVLQEVVSRHHLHQHSCTTLMDIAEYQLLLVEAPEVPQAELGAAIRWRVRDLIDYHVDDAMVDVFDAPASSARGTQSHLYAVVSRVSAIQERVDQLQKAGAKLEVIDIPELALRNIVSRIPENAGGVALLYFGPDQGLITLIRDSVLYLARPLDIGYRELQESEQPQQLWDRLSLEVQRSMDYYDRHFQQAQISNVLIAPLPFSVEGMAQGLQNTLGFAVRDLQLNEIVQHDNKLSAADAAHCFLAVGAALRIETARL